MFRLMHYDTPLRTPLFSSCSIYSIHRGDSAKATDQMAQAKALAKKELIPIVEQFPQLRYGAFSSSMEEFAEAAIFAEFVANGRVPTVAELEIVTKEEYLGGIMDFTGELNRFAVIRATARDIEGVRRCRDVVDQLFAQLMLFEWRNGNLRRKFDAVRGRGRHKRGRQSASPCGWALTHETADISTTYVCIASYSRFLQRTG